MRKHIFASVNRKSDAHISAHTGVPPPSGATGVLFAGVLLRAGGSWKTGASLPRTDERPERGTFMLSTLQNLGIRSEHAYTAGFASIGLSLLTWTVDLGKTKDKAQADRWGLYIGEWAPTFFALGVALKLEETTGGKRK